MHKGTGRPNTAGTPRSQVSASCALFAARDGRDRDMLHRSCNWAAPLLQSCSSGANTTKIAGYQLLQVPTYIDTRACEWCGYMGWGLGWTGRLTCDATTTAEHSAVARAAMQSTICLCCISLVGQRQRRHACAPSHSRTPSSLQTPIGLLCRARWPLQSNRIRCPQLGRTER